MATIPTYKFLPAHLADRLDGISVGVRSPLPGGSQGQHRSRHHGSSVEFADYRAYAPGDPIHRIDWALYARSDRYLVRRFEDETRLRVHLLLDTSESMSFRTAGPCSKLEHACYLAAGLMYVLVKQRDAVGLHCFAEKLDHGFASAGSYEGLRPMLRGLERLSAKGGGKVDRVLHEFADTDRPRGLVVVLSDFLQDADLILAGVRHLVHAGHQVTLLHVLDRAELTLPFDGVVEINEMETGRRVVVEIDEFRSAYVREVQRHVEGLRRGCANAPAGYHLADTSVPVDQAIRSGMAWI
jgi:uncharacterized protein (DUF58 family)